MFNEHSYYRDIQVMFSLLLGLYERRNGYGGQNVYGSQNKKNKKTLTSSGCIWYHS